MKNVLWILLVHIVQNIFQNVRFRNRHGVQFKIVIPRKIDLKHTVTDGKISYLSYIKLRRMTER